MVKFNACKLLSLRMMAILLLFLNGCASIGSIQPEKESLQELSIRIPEIGAFIKSQKTYQELSPDAQSAYIDSKARIEIAKLFLNDKRFSSEQITMIVMQQRTLSDIKKTIRTDETIAPQIRDSAVAEINAVQTAYDIQIPKEIVMIYVFLQKPGVFTDGSSEYIEVVNKNEFVGPPLRVQDVAHSPTQRVQRLPVAVHREDDAQVRSIGPHASRAPPSHDRGCPARHVSLRPPGRSRGVDDAAGDRCL